MSLADRFASWRNGLISDPGFQAWAVRNPLTRPIARRKAKATFDLVAGFVYSQVLAAVVESGLLETVRKSSIDAAEFASLSQLPTDGAARLLRAAAALDLVRTQSGGRFALGQAGAALLGNPAVFAMIRHHKAFYSDLADTLALLRARRPDTQLARFWAYGPESPGEDAAAYSALMAETQALIAQTVLAAYDFRRHRTVMDVGGGVGEFLSKVAEAHPDIALVLVDLPSVARLAEATLADRRIRIEPRDMLRDALPGGADLITLIRVLHDHDDAPVLQLLSSIRTALAPGGRLLIAEPMAGIRGSEAMADAYFGLYLWAMGRGRPRRPDELTRLLRDAGFQTARQIPTLQPLMVSAIIAS